MGVVINMIFRRSNRSAITPPKNTKMMVGNDAATPKIARSVADPLNSKTNHAWPIITNCVAPTEPREPSQ